MAVFGSAKPHIDPNKLPIFVHSIESREAFGLCDRAWEANKRGVLTDSTNRKDFLRFVFTNPACVVWIQRDLNRSDTFELILIWEGKKEDITEVYVVSSREGNALGDDARIKSLLTAILSMPAVVPVNQHGGK
jgi:hypothetical protein